MNDAARRTATAATPFVSGDMRVASVANAMAQRRLTACALHTAMQIVAERQHGAQWPRQQSQG